MAHLGLKNELSRDIIFTFAYQKNFDYAIVSGLFDALGLKTADLLEGFSNYYSGNFAGKCLEAIRRDKYLLSRDLAIAKTAGKVLVTVSVAVTILNQITAFLADFSARLLE